MVMMPNMYKIITVKVNAHEVYNTERPTKGSGHGKMIDPRRNSTYERPFTKEGNYLVLCSDITQIYGQLEQGDLGICAFCPI